MSEVVYLGGLPRSCSTLLVNLLSQHPDITSSTTSPLESMVMGIRMGYGNRDEFKAGNPEEMSARTLNCIAGLINGWGHSTTPIFIDKDRGWVSSISTLERVFNKPPKIIVPIRDLRGVFGSMEEIYRNNNLNIDPIKLQDTFSGITMEDRFERWSCSLPIGPAIGNLRDVISKGELDKVHIIRMEDLCKDPQGELDRIYKYLEIKGKDIEYPIYNVTPEDDRAYRIEGLHDIYSKGVRSSPDNHEEILGKDICNQIRNGYSWFYERFYPEL